MKTPPFDDTPEDLSPHVAGHILTIEDPDYVPVPEREVPPPAEWQFPAGCVVLIVGAAIGLCAGTAISGALAFLYAILA